MPSNVLQQIIIKYDKKNARDFGIYIFCPGFSFINLESLLNVNSGCLLLLTV